MAPLEHKPGCLQGNEAGFTLSEILVVLSIFILLSSLSLGLMPAFHHTLKEKQFIKQLKNDIFYTEQYAISHQSSMVLHINRGERKYTISSNSKGEVLQREIPEWISFQNISLSYVIMFKQNGNCINAGVLIIQTEKAKYKWTQYVGNGRFIIEKL